MKRWLVCLHHRLFDRPLGNDGLTPPRAWLYDGTGTRLIGAIGPPGPPLQVVVLSEGRDWIHPTDWP